MMNVKKQLNKIRDYVEELETLSDKQHTELHQYKLTAHKFVNQKITPTDALEEFRALLGDTMFIGNDYCGDVMEKMVDNVWQPIRPTPDEVHYGSNHIQSPTYSELENENARLREALRWHPVSELPKIEIKQLWTVSVLLKINEVEPIIAYYGIRSKCWYDYYKSECVVVNKNSRWCYIPEDNGGE
jgi:hypothetical protein